MEASANISLPVGAVLLQVGYNDVPSATSTAKRLALMHQIISRIRSESGRPDRLFYIGGTQDRTGDGDRLRFQREAEMLRGQDASFNGQSQDAIVSSPPSSPCRTIQPNRSGNDSGGGISRSGG